MIHERVPARRLTIYCSETSKHQGKPLFDWLIHQALKREMRGATAFKAISGFGQHHHLHHAHLIDLSCELPVVVEIIDTLDRIEAYLETVAEALDQHTYILEEVICHVPRARS